MLAVSWNAWMLFRDLSRLLQKSLYCICSKQTAPPHINWSLVNFPRLIPWGVYFMKIMYLDPPHLCGVRRALHCIHLAQGKLPWPCPVKCFFYQLLSCFFHLGTSVSLLPFQFTRGMKTTRLCVHMFSIPRGEELSQKFSQRSASVFSRAQAAILSYSKYPERLWGLGLPSFRHLQCPWVMLPMTLHVA